MITLHRWAAELSLRGVLLVVLCALVAYTAATVAVSRAVDRTPPLVAQPRDVVVPASPGLTAALTVCKQGMVSKVEMQETAGDYRYTAIFGLDVLRWPDSPKGRNPIGLLNGEPLTLSEELQKCLRDRS